MIKYKLMKNLELKIRAIFTENIINSNIYKIYYTEIKGRQILQGHQVQDPLHTEWQDQFAEGHPL